MKETAKKDIKGNEENDQTRSRKGQAQEFVILQQIRTDQFRTNGFVSIDCNSSLPIYVFCVNIFQRILEDRKHLELPPASW